jgi:hypothetical protein
MSIFTFMLGLSCRRRTKVYRDLASLDDRTLVDIGLVRAELRFPGGERHLSMLVALEPFQTS